MKRKHLATNGLPIPIIDLFAGPGGLGEGFSASGDEHNYTIALSIERDPHAHQTLRLRAFQRKLALRSRLPQIVVDHANGLASVDDIEKVYPSEWRAAEEEANCCTLGVDNDHIFALIKRKLDKVRDGRWILIGGPPCQAYSLAGRARNSRARRNGIYKPENDQRHYLYTEYLKIIAQFHPAVFVMENVKGMLSAQLDGGSMFQRIQSDLCHPQAALGIGEEFTYRLYSVATPVREDEGDVPPRDFIVASENHGIPQRRHRVIIVGVRSDYECDPAKLLLAPRQEVTCGQAIRDLPKLRSKASGRDDSTGKWHDAIRKGDWRLLLGATVSGRLTDTRKRLYDELQTVLPELIGAKSGKATPGGAVLTALGRRPSGDLGAWYTKEEADIVFNHETRSHMDRDLWRYMFSSVYARVNGDSPTLMDFPSALLPEHANVEKSIATRALFADRFRVQLENQPSRTVTSHISKDGHSYIHFDPRQCRSLTVREAARLQTFPDDYIFCGPRTSQFHQVGNAVPPYLAFQIANAIAEAMGLT